MGVDGVSSDEYDEEATARNGYKTYTIRERPHFLSHEVSVLMRKLDWIYSVRLMAGQKKGFTTRFREPGHVPSSRTEPYLSLPINAYDTIWFSKLRIQEQLLIAAKPQRHDFAVPPALLKNK